MIHSNNDYHYAEGDGVTHINIGFAAKTELGRLLDMPARTTFVHPNYGPFYSMESFWAWIRSPDHDESLRNKRGIEAKEERAQRQTVYINNLEDVMTAALYEKVIQNEDLLALFRDNALPFDMYYIFHPQVDSPEVKPLLLRHRLSSFSLRIVNRVGELIKNDEHPLRSWYIAIPAQASKPAA